MEIYVYENGIIGVGRVSLSNFTVHSFRLEYKNISSVDISSDKHNLSINAFGKSYLVSVPNPNEIADIINHQLRQTSKMT